MVKGILGTGRVGACFGWQFLYHRPYRGATQHPEYPRLQGARLVVGVVGGFLNCEERWAW